MRIFAGVLATMVLATPIQAQQASQILNQLRGSQGLAPVAASDRLEEAAKAHALDMARKGFFSHTGSNGSSVMARAQKAGYAPCMIAENIAQGQMGLAEVMQDWANSPGHRQNMLLDEVKEYGLVRAEGNIWVMVLGRDGC